MKTLTDKLKIIPKKINFSLPLVLSASLALAQIQGCASITSVGSQRPRPTSETVQYKSKFEESVIREMPRGFERDYYAALYNLFLWWYPEEAKKQVLSSLDTLSVVTQKPIVDSLINIYTLPLNAQPDEPGNKFLRKDIPDMVNWCNSHFSSHPGALYLSKYFDDPGILILGKGLPSKPPKSTEEKARTTMRVKFEAAEVETRRIEWKINEGEYIFQDDGYGYWVYRSNSLDEDMAEKETLSDKDKNKEFNKMLKGLTFTAARRNIEFKKPIRVQDQDEILAQSSGDLNVVPFLIADSSEEYYAAVLNLGIKLDDFMKDSLLSLKGKYSIRVLGSDSTILQDSISVNTFLKGYQKGNKDRAPLQFVSQAFPKNFGRNGLVRCVLGLNIEAKDNKHYKTSAEFIVGQVPGRAYFGLGWVVDAYSVNRNYIGGKRFIPFEEHHPRDTISLLFQLPHIQRDRNGKYTSHLEFGIEKKEKPKEFSEIKFGQLFVGRPPASEMYSKQERKFAVENIETKTDNDIIILPVILPDLEKGLYKITAYRYGANKNEETHRIVFDNIFIKKR